MNPISLLRPGDRLLLLSVPGGMDRIEPFWSTVRVTGRRETPTGAVADVVSERGEGQRGTLTAQDSWQMLRG